MLNFWIQIKWKLQLINESKSILNWTTQEPTFPWLDVHLFEFDMFKFTNILDIVLNFCN